jgi:hypothetical protein
MKESLSLAFLAIASLLTMEATASIPTDQKQNLRSAEGVEIAVRYSVDPNCQLYKNEEGRIVALQVANPVSINLMNVPKDAQTITAKIEFWERSTVYHGGPLPELRRVYNHFDRDVTFEESSLNAYMGHVEGAVATRRSISSSASGYQVVQTIEFKITDSHGNERSLVDPVSETTRFQISLGDGNACLNF